MLPSPELPPKTSEWDRTKAILGAITTVLVVAAVLYLCYELRGIGLLIFLAVLFAYMLAPVVALMEKPFRFRGRTRRLSRGEAIAAVYTLGVAFIVGGLYEVIPRVAHQLGALDRDMPTVMGSQRDFSAQLVEKYHSYRLPPAMRNAIDQVAHQTLDSLHQSMREGLMEAAGMFRFLPWLILIPVIAVFLLKDAPSFRSTVLRLLPVGRVRWRGREFFEDVNQTIAFYVRAQLLACLFVGVVCTLGFLIIQVPYALLLGVFAGCLELVPLVGPLLTAIAAGFIAASNSPQVAVYTVIFLATLRVIHDNIVYPRLIASGIKLHPLVVILALLCGAQLAGVVGLFLAIPLTAFLTVAWRHLSRQWNSDGLFAEILKAREPEPPLHVSPVRAVNELPVPIGPESAPLAGVSVLAVDDDDDGRLLLAGLLERQGATVTTAGSVAQALEILLETRFDVLLTDIGMPGEDGFELIRKVRALDKKMGGDVPAAALTGYNTEEDRERATAAGFHQHLGKPIDATELLRTVQSLARMSRARSAAQNLAK